MNLPRAALVEAAQESIAKGSKSFAVASKLFDPATRERAWLLYAWCRACDDLADGQAHGHALSAVADPQARLAEIRAKTDAALRGEPTGDPAFDALGVVAAECAIPHHLPHALVEGFALDAAGFSPRNEAELLQYCYHVAGAVGCMMAIVMGVAADDEAVLDRACDLGMAFQLANIARDVAEDDAGGRCYLPAEWLAEMDIPPGETMRALYRERLGMLGQRLARTAAGYEESARHGTPALSYRSAWAVLAAAGIYGDIAREVGRRGSHAWDERVVTSKAGKLRWVAKAAVEARLRARLWPGDGPAPGCGRGRGGNKVIPVEAGIHVSLRCRLACGESDRLQPALKRRGVGVWPRSCKTMHMHHDSTTLPCACTALRKASRAVSRVYDEALAGAGMTTPQFAILRNLVRLGAMPLSRLADLLVMDRTSLYRMIAPMVRHGWLRIDAAPRGRAKAAIMTPEGEAAMVAATPLWERAQTRIVETLGTANWAALAASLGDVTAIAVGDAT